jgi:hypothetical protein
VSVPLPLQNTKSLSKERMPTIANREGLENVCIM